MLYERESRAFRKMKTL